MTLTSRLHSLRPFASVRHAGWIALAFTALALGSAFPAAASYTGCIQLTAPAYPPLMITQPGVYCLVEDITVSGPTNAITIDSDDVTLDLNGHTVLDPSPGYGYPGIIIRSQRVELRNGKIVGFEIGLDSHCYGGGSVVIERLQIDGSFSTGVWLGCDGTVFRDNVITRTGSATTWGTGIIIDGSRIQVVDNTVTGVEGQGNAAAVETAYGSGNLVLGNRLTDATHGVYNAGAPGDLRCRDNVTADVATPYSNCTDLGNNH